jgi:3-methyladenine DNA glycosylase Tag
LRAGVLAYSIAMTEPPRDGLAPGPDGKPRCSWGVSTPDYVDYHDREWGFPVVDDRRLFEKLCLEGFQAGLSWLTILRKREAFRRGFAGFDPAAVARFGARDVTRLLGDPGIVRHRGKIESTINNAARALEVIDERGSLAGRAARDDADADLGRAVQGSQAPRLDLRRADHGLRVHAGDGAGRRSPRGLRDPARRRGRAQEAPRGGRGPRAHPHHRTVSGSAAGRQDPRTRASAMA